MHKPVDRPESLGFPRSNPPLFHWNADRLWRPLRASAVWIFGILTGCVLMALLAFLLTRPAYLAEASIRIDTSAQRVVGTEENASPMQGSDTERQLQTTLVVARSMPVLEAVIHDLKLDQDDAFLRAMQIEPATDKAARHAQIVDLLQTGRVTEILPNTRVAVIGFTAPEPQLAARVANSLADNLLRYDLAQRAEQSASARRYLEGELARLRGGLVESETRANAYARQAAIIGMPGGTDLVSGGTLTSETLVQVNAQLAQATAQRIRAQADWAAVANMPALSIPQVNGNAAVQSLLGQQVEAQAQLQAASARHGPLHPEVRQLQAQADTLSRELANVSGAIKRGLRAPLASAVRDENQLQARLAALRGARLTEQDRGVALSMLEREANTRREQYEALLARLNQLDAEAGAQVSNLALIDRAVPPDNPVRPSLLLFLAIGLGVGAVLALLFVVLRELFNAPIRTAGDVTTQLGLPVLASVPQLRDKPQTQACFSEVVASLQFATPAGFPSSIAITSPTVGDGKSCCTFALARALGAAGQRVLVIDGDLRRPGQNRLFGVPNGLGLADFLAGEAALADAVATTSLANVSLLSVGAVQGDPGALLASPRLRDLIAEAEAQFDVVLIDAPPLIGLGDPLLLASVAERQLLVLRAEATRAAEAQAAVMRMAQMGMMPLGAILTFYRPTRAEHRAYTAYRLCPAE